MGFWTMAQDSTFLEIIAEIKKISREIEVINRSFENDKRAVPSRPKNAAKKGRKKSRSK